MTKVDAVSVGVEKLDGGSAKEILKHLGKTNEAVQEYLISIFTDDEVGIFPKGVFSVRRFDTQGRPLLRNY